MGFLPRLVKKLDYHDEEHMRAGRELGFTMYVDVSVVALVLSNLFK